eukprot:gene95-124_t
MPVPNQLIHTTNPYLLQHAQNPVDWYPWGERALQKAQQEDKPIILSIGYAACHWCHVMEKESFNDQEVATIMNRHFINIKVDREEKPDIDQIAIAAIQSMGLSVGWPLHLFLLPNQQPFYGCTYVANAAWKQLLNSLISAFEQHRERLYHTASYFINTVPKALCVTPHQQNKTNAFTKEDIQQVVQAICQQLDKQKGGLRGAPKFPMPSINAFLLQYTQVFQDEVVSQQVQTNLTQMACGGIYDHIGGGFYRYTTDEGWQVPHFEKMLCDNAQLISLYAQAYGMTAHPLYKTIVEETVAFVIRELSHPAGGFYAALDSDSQGEEGAFYTWTYDQIAALLHEHTAWFTTKFQVTKTGNWYHGRNILSRNPTFLQPSHESTLLNTCKQVLLHARNTSKVQPFIDNQLLTSWNGMMIQALIDAYYALGATPYLTLAMQTMRYLEASLVHQEQVYHVESQKALGATGYLEDYAWIIKALISLYEATFQEEWLNRAMHLTEQALQHFANPDHDLLYFTAADQPVFMHRPLEMYDQTTPSSNAVMAHNLFRLSHVLKQTHYSTKFTHMLNQITSPLNQSPAYMSYWANLHLMAFDHFPTALVIGPERIRWGQAIKQQFPAAVLASTTSGAHMPWLKHEVLANEKTTLYLCDKTACYEPITSLTNALAWIKQHMVG